MSGAGGEDAAARRAKRDLVRRGYDAVSLAYRGDDGQARAGSGEDAGSAEQVRRYAGWVDELAGLLRPGARVLDLGCGAGIPATRELADRGLQVLGVDISAVQLSRARRLVPGASLVQADMAMLELAPGSLDAVACFYALFHIPLADQRPLFPRIRAWLRPGGYLLATTGAEAWTGVESFHGAQMFWDHGGTDDYLRWFGAAGLEPLWHRFVPEGQGGHTLILARAR